MKQFINKILDVPKLILRIWIILWMCLAILLVMKFCFGIWYPVVSNNEIFNNVCKFIDENKWLHDGISYILYVFSFNLTYMTCRGLTKYSKWYMYIIAIIITIGLAILKQFNNTVGFIIEIHLLVVVPIILNIIKCRFKNNIYNVCVPVGFYILLNLWQLTIYLVRGLEIELLTSLPTLILLILQLDYYIFTIISWIGVSRMGFAGVGWLWSKDITVLKAEKEKELKKAKPNMKKVETLDIEIAKLEKEGK